MKYAILLPALAISCIGSTQSYQMPTPQVLKSIEAPASSEIGTLSWFFPTESFKSAKQFEKIELGIKVPPSIEHRIKGYFERDHSVRNPINPFDRHAIDITAEFYVEGKKVKTIDAFYFEEYKRDLTNNTWRKDTTSYSFRIRYTPEFVGEHQVKIRIEASDLAATTVETRFFVNPSDHKGFLEQGTHARHFRFSKGKESFVGVGQEIPWATYEDWGSIDKAAGPVMFMALYHSMNKMQQAGGNFTRFVVAPWFLQLEWEALGNYQPKMAHAWEFDRMNDVCSKYELYYLFCGLLHAPLESRTDEEDKGQLPGVRWEAYCYNDNDVTPATQVAHSPKLGLHNPVDFYTNEKAFDHQQNYFRYLISRWGYATSLAGWQLMSEVDQTCAYRDEVKEDGTVIDNSENRAAVNRWTAKMSSYMANECDDRHLKSIALITGKNYGSYLWDPELYLHEEMAFVGLHDYVFEMDPPTKNIRNRNIIQRYESVRNLGVGWYEGALKYPQFQQRMFIYDEFGHVIVIPRAWPEDAGDDPVVDFNNCADFMFKQDLWFTFASGCAVAGLDWWNPDQQKRHDQWRRYFPGLRKFIQEINFEAVNYTAVKAHRGEVYIAQRWPFRRKDIGRSNHKNYRKSDLIEAYVQIDSLGNQGFGWMLNRSFTWMNLVDSMECFQPMVNGTEPYSKPYLVKGKDDDIPESPVNVGEKEAFIRIYNLKSRRKYHVDFYDTETMNIIASKEVKSSGSGKVKLYAPQMKYAERYDVAFKFYDLECGWKK